VIRLKKTGAFFYRDANGTKYFCVRDYLRKVKLPDTPTMRRIVIEEVQNMAPWMPLIDEAPPGEDSAGGYPYDA